MQHAWSTCGTRSSVQHAWSTCITRSFVSVSTSTFKMGPCNHAATSTISTQPLGLGAIDSNPLDFATSENTSIFTLTKFLTILQSKHSKHDIFCNKIIFYLHIHRRVPLHDGDQETTNNGFTCPNITYTLIFVKRNSCISIPRNIVSPSPSPRNSSCPRLSPLLQPFSK